MWATEECGPREIVIEVEKSAKYPGPTGKLQEALGLSLQKVPGRAFATGSKGGPNLK